MWSVTDEKPSSNLPQVYSGGMELFSSRHRLDHLHISAATNHHCKERRNSNAAPCRTILNERINDTARPQYAQPCIYKEMPILCPLAVHGLLRPDELIICFQFLSCPSLVPNRFFFPLRGAPSHRNLLRITPACVGKHTHGILHIPDTQMRHIRPLLKVFQHCCNSIRLFFF